MTWCHTGYSIAETRAFLSVCAYSWQQGKRYSFAIIDPQDETLLGSVGLSCVNQSHRFANLGYWVRTSRTGEGVASAATLRAARCGLSELGLNRLELVVPVNNQPSQRVAERVGARREGILRKRLLLQGKSHDALLYSLVAEDLASAKRLSRCRAAHTSVSEAR
jgi:RimJ/RimL family protein N-acetyltransferase